MLRDGAAQPLAAARVAIAEMRRLGREVAPNEAAKLAVPSGVPRRAVWVATLIGIEPALVREVKANTSTGKIFFR